MPPPKYTSDNIKKCINTRLYTCGKKVKKKYMITMFTCIPIFGYLELMWGDIRVLKDKI